MTRWMSTRRITAPAVALLMLFASLVLVSPVGSVEVDPDVDGVVLVVAPHPDDDVITAAGITFERPDTYIAFMTNGDSHQRSEAGTVTTVVSPSRFKDTTATFLDMPVNTPITVTIANLPVVSSVKKVWSETEIELNTAIPGLAKGSAYETAPFTPIDIADTRQGEAVAAQAILGRAENELIFLGYPDFYLPDVWATSDPDVVQGPAPDLRTETYASRGLGGTDWHNYRFGGHGDYNREGILEDMVALIDDLRPAHVFTTSPEDGTGDHRTTYAVVKAAMEQVHANDSSYLARLHSSVVWQNPPDPRLNERWPSPYVPGNPVVPHSPPVDAATRSALGIGGEFAPDWDDREIFNVPSEMLVDPNDGDNPKWDAILAHASQGGQGTYISNFMHADEFFWVEAIPGEPLAIDDGPFSVDQGQAFSTNGVLDNDTGLELTAGVFDQPDHGTVDLNPDGSFTYVHDGSAGASDTFTYRATDAIGTNSSPATVTITVIPGPTTTTTLPSGDGLHSVGLVDPGSGRWYLYDSAGVLKASFYYGNPGDYPIYGDWNGDGVETPGLYRQSDGYVYLRNSNTQGIADIKFFFGNPGDVPIAGDFNGDGFDTVSIYRPSNQTFYIINKLGSGDQGLGAADFSYVFGNPGDKPFVGDFNGNGIETAGLHRESTGLVYFRNTHTQGNADAQFIFGDPGDRLVAGDWTGDGTFTPALFRPSNTTMYFRYTNTQGNADNQWVGGQAPWLPVSGNNGLG